MTVRRHVIAVSPEADIRLAVHRTGACSCSSRLILVLFSDEHAVSFHPLGRISRILDLNMPEAFIARHVNVLQHPCRHAILFVQVFNFVDMLTTLQMLCDCRYTLQGIHTPPTMRMIYIIGVFCPRRHDGFSRKHGRQGHFWIIIVLDCYGGSPTFGSPSSPDVTPHHFHKTMQADLNTSPSGIARSAFLEHHRTCCWLRRRSVDHGYHGGPHF